MKRNVYLSTALILLLFALNSLGQTNPFLIESVRSISTGGALVAVSSDENLIFFNPAGLANVENSKLTAFYLGTNFNIDSIKSIYELESAYSEAKDFAKLSPESISKLQGYNPILFVSPASVVYIHPNFALSFLKSGVSVKAGFDRNEKESIVKFSGIGDSMLAGAMGFQVINNLSVGGNIKYIYRLKMDENNASDLMDDKYTIFLGRYIGADIGVLWKKEPLNVGLSINDILGTKFSWQKEISEGKLANIEKPFDTEVDRTLNLGVSYRPEWKFTRYPDIPRNLIFAFDISGVHSKDIHIGMETELFRWLSLRMGINSGLRFGVGFHTNMWSIDLVYATKLYDKYFDYTTKNNICFSVAFGY